ncbi:hypothetical protein [Embleya sp. AB8]
MENFVLELQELPAVDEHQDLEPMRCCDTCGRSSWVVDVEDVD